ncbi:MAG TPA: NUDIX hydrolase [Candidatus Saccharimonadales bacterium]|nr:NUDIX hydrolase [Candidatus Saccharimonadales bacterium]
MLQVERNIIIPTDMGFDVTDHVRARKGDHVTKRMTDGRFLKAGTVPINSLGQVALIRKEDGVRWGLAKGHVDVEDAIHFADDFVQALRLTAGRETAEETGKIVELDSFLNTEMSDKADGHNSIIYYFGARIVGQTGKRSEKETILVDVEDAPGLVVPELAGIVTLAIERWATSYDLQDRIPSQGLMSVAV